MSRVPARLEVPVRLGLFALALLAVLALGYAGGGALGLPFDPPVAEEAGAAGGPR